MTRLLIVAALATLSSVASAQSVAVTLSEWKVRLATDTVKAGPVTFRVTNEGSMTHAIHVKGTDVDKSSPTVGPRESASLTVTLKPGTYEVYCPMSEDSHRQAGMTTRLVVTGGSAPDAPREPGP